MSKQLWTLLTLLIVLAALAVTGCGGDSGESETAGGDSTSEAVADTNAPPITKAVLLKKGDAVCAQGRERLSEAGNRLFAEKPSDREAVEIELVSDVLVPVLQTDVDDLQALGAPPGDDEEVGAIIEGMEELQATAEEEPEAFVISEDPSVKRPDQWRPADKLAEEYGFKECPRS